MSFALSGDSLIFVSLDGMSRLTRTGFWLIPWLPTTIAILLARDLFWPASFIVNDGPYTTAQFIWNVFYNVLLWPSFGIGLLLLLITSIRHLVRLRRHSA